MSDSGNPFGLGKLVPGFDFLQNLLNSAAQASGGSGRGGAQAPGLANWIAPTLNVEDLERRIGELKAVNFWLDQNSRALAATVQALEVQKMTLATLKGMNFAMGDVAQAFRIKPEEDKPQPAAKSAERGAPAASPSLSPAKEAAKVYAKSFESSPALDSGDGRPSDSPAAAASQRAPAAAAKAADPAEPAPQAADADTAADKSASPAKLVDPLQWWGALTGQFQQIAANAMQEAANHPALDMTRGMTTQALKAVNEMTASIGDAARKTGKAAAAPAKKKSAAKKSSARKKPAAKAASKSGG